MNLPKHIIKFISNYEDGATRKVLTKLFLDGYVSRLDPEFHKSENSIHSIISHLRNNKGIPVFSRKVKGSNVKEYFIPNGIRINMMRDKDEMNAIILKRLDKAEDERFCRNMRKFLKLIKVAESCGLEVTIRQK